MLPMRLQFGITPKLTLVFAIFAAALLAGLGGLAYANGRASLDAATKSELFSSALDKQAALNNWVDEHLSAVTALANTPSLIDSVETLSSAAPGAPEARAAHDNVVADLHPRIGSGQAFLALFVIEPENAQVIASTNPDDEGKFKETFPYFIQGKNGPYIQNVYYSMDLQAPAMTVSAPLHAADGRLLGVLAGRLNLADMNAIIQQRTGLHQTDDAFLVNTSNLFVTQPRLQHDPSVLQRGIHTVAVERCLAHGSGVISALDYRGIPSTIVYRWLPEREVCLIVKMNQAEAFAPVNALGKTLALVGGLVFALGMLVAFLLAQGFTRPIHQLVQGAQQIGLGNLDYRIELKSNDELGKLANTFNEAAGQLSHSRRELEASNKELEAFSYSVSHDLRAPLRAIDGFSRILLEDYQTALPAEASRYLDLVCANTEKMGELVDDLLAFSRLSRQPLRKQTVAPEDIVRQVLADLHAEQDRRQIEIVIGDLPACEGDHALLKQVYVNLLANAIKFTSKREVARIEVSSIDRAGVRVYFVRDNGVGFDMQYVNKLFGVFQRLHRAEDYEGTGVGLAIVQRIINRHGGRVWAEAELDRGATFYFTLSGGTS